MADSAKITALEDGIKKSLDGMISRGKSTSSYLNRNLLQQFKDAQNQRFQTLNSSQGSTWAPTTQKYSNYKRKKFASYPGAGNALMVATGRLAAGAMGQDASNYYKTVTDRSFTFGINLGTLPYAKYPGVRRPFMSFSDDTLVDWYTGIQQYITKGKT